MIFSRHTFAALAIIGFAAITVAEETVVAYNQQGIESFQAGDVDSAIFYFNEALKLDPNSEVIQRNLSNAYQSRAVEFAEAQNFVDAIDDLERALRVDPENHSSLIQLGTIHLIRGEVGDAIFRLEEAVEMQPGSVDAHFLLGEAYYRDNDMVSARDQWNWVYRVDPKLPGLSERLQRVKREAAVEGEFEWKGSQHFSVTYDPDLDYGDMKQVLRILEDAYDHVGRQLERTYPPGPIQATLYSAAGFTDSTTMGGHIAGIWDGNRIRCPVLRPDGSLIDYELLTDVLYHEYAHVVIGYIAPGNVPWWLNEGIAESVSGEMTREEIANLRYLAENELFYPLESLVANQLAALSPEQLQIAYLQAHATVRYLFEDYGSRRIVGMLEDLNEGESDADALRSNLRHSYKSLQRETIEWILDL